MLVVKWGSCTFRRVKYLCGLIFLTLCVQARAQEAAGAANEAESVLGESEIRGRVYERGSLTPLNGARVVTTNVRTSTDEDGHFVLRVPAGDVEISITLDGYEPFKVKETVAPGQGLRVEYRLLPLATYKKRYVSTVRGEARHEGERFELRDEELHQAPGSLGDPFRVVGLLPGVAAPITLLPIYVIRGASPGTNGFFLDGMRVPQLFHFVVGGGVIHPRLVDRLDFYPGVYDVSFGHYAGGIIDSETRPGRSDARAHGEIELKLYDLSALIEVRPTKDLTIEAAGHYGYPSFLVHALDNRVDLSYWDFQLRADWKTLTLEAFGSYDFLSFVTDQGRPATPTRPAIPPSVSNNSLEFYRVQLRDRHKLGRLETEVALVGGYDYFEAVGPTVTKIALDWRANVSARWSRFRLRAGIDGEVSRFTGSNFMPGTGADQPDAFGDLNGNRDGFESGAYVEGTLEIIKRRLWATAGVRADVYHAKSVTLVGVDPRFQFRAKLLPQLSVNGGIGLYQQPPSFPIQLPGIDTFALQLGLQRAIQAAYGVEATLPQQTMFSITGFWEQFYNVNDALIDFTTQVVCTAPPPESLTGFPSRITRQIDGQSYGMEVMARKRVGRITGWIAYTVSRTERRYSCGLRPADYDQTHVLNVIVQARLPWNLMAGVRFLLQTGRPVTIIDPMDIGAATRNNTRLPNYYQLDIRVDREWLFQKWALSVFLEILNLTYSQSVLGISYPTVPDPRNPNNDITDYTMPQLNGFNWILPSVGIRGRF